MDYRDHMPPPPCMKCGKGLCVKADEHAGYRCPECGENYALMIYEGPRSDVLRQLAPIMMQFKQTTSHWMTAMEGAFDQLDYNAAMTAMANYKDWLDQVATPMIDRIRQIKDGTQADPIPPGDLEIPGGWGPGKNE